MKVNKKQLKAKLKPLIRECINEVLSEMLIESKLAGIVAESVSRVLNENSAAAPSHQQAPKQEMSIEEMFQRNMASNRLDERVTPPTRPSMSVGGVDIFADVGAPIGRGDSPEALMAEHSAGAMGGDADLAALGLDFDVMQRAAGIEVKAPQQLQSNFLEEQRLASLRASLDVPVGSPEATQAIINTRTR